MGCKNVFCQRFGEILFQSKSQGKIQFQFLAEILEKALNFQLLQLQWNLNVAAMRIFCTSLTISTNIWLNIFKVAWKNDPLPKPDGVDSVTSLSTGGCWNSPNFWKTSAVF